MRYSRQEVERIAKVAFESARRSVPTVVSHLSTKPMCSTSPDSGERLSLTSRADYPDVTLEHQLVDSCALLLVSSPHKFDVLLAGNLFGDILSDEAGAVVGSVGTVAVLPASAVEAASSSRCTGRHQTSPGRIMANPVATIASAALLLRHALGLNEEALKIIEAAIGQTLAAGIRTADLGVPRGAGLVLDDDPRHSRPTPLLVSIG